MRSDRISGAVVLSGTAAYDALRIPVSAARGETWSSLTP